MDSIIILIYVRRGLMAITESAYLGNIQIRNRLVRSATWEGLCDCDGRIPAELYGIYNELADGGVGLIVTGLIDVCPYDIGIEGNMRLISDGLIPEYRVLTDSIHRRGAKIFAQLNINRYTRQSGEKVSVNEMTEGDIALAAGYFLDGARRAYRAGFDGIQLHLAYSWLLNRFLDPNQNHRADLYGASTENRCRIVLDIISEIRKALPGFHISAKFSFWHSGDGFDAEEGSKAVKLLSRHLDSIELLGEGCDLESDRRVDSIYLPLVSPIIKDLSCPVILTGNNRDLIGMEKIHREYGIEAFGLCRALIRESDLPNKFVNGASTRSLCRACGGCNSTNGSRCVFNIKKS